MKKRSFTILLSSLVLLAACGPVREPGHPPVTERGTEAGNVPDRVSPSRHRVVLLLLQRARGLQAQGSHARAMALVERAVRIDPQDPRVWMRMASIRLQQGRYGQAESLAQRALSLAGEWFRLRAELWRLIARSRYRRGDWSGADRAMTRAVEMERRSGS